MAVKSVVDVEVNDDEFKEFAGLFQKYQEQLAKTPSSWADASKESKAAYSNFSQIAAALMAQNTLSRKKAADEREGTKRLKEQSGYWKEMVRGSREFASNVSGITKDLLRWASLGSIFTGLAGAGGLFGLDRLADDVNAQRRASMGMGMTYGERRAFEVDYGRVVDPGALLGGVQEALQDPTKRQTLYAAGMSERDIAGKDTAQVSQELLGKLKDLVDRTDPRYLQTVVQSLGLTQFGSLQDFQRLRATPRGELNEYARAYQRDRTALGLDPRGQKVWQDFSVQMTRAKSKIENVFVRGLEPLINPLNHLSDSVVKAIDTFLSSKKLGPWIEKFGTAIEGAAKYITSDSFQKNVADFASDIGALASAVASGLRALGILPPKAGEAPPVDLTHGPGRAAGSVRDRAQANGLPTLWQELHGGIPQGWQSGSQDMERAYGLDRGLLSSVQRAEGEWDARTGTWKDGPMTRYGTRAHGPFQFMDATAQSYGLKNPNDFWSSADAAGRLLRDLKKQFGGDTAKAVAAYNWNPAGVAKDVRLHGDKWRDFLPDETKNYLNKVLGGVGPQRERSVAEKLDHIVQEFSKSYIKKVDAEAAARRQKQEQNASIKHQPPTTVTVQVKNETGGNVVVQANQLPSPVGLKSVNAR